MTTAAVSAVPPAERLLAAARVLHEDAELPRVLERILDEAVAALGAERGFCVLYTPGGFEVAAARHFDRESIARAAGKLSRTLLGRVRAAAGPVRLADALDAGGLAAAPSVRAQGLRSVLALPLSPPGAADPLGALVLDNRFRPGVFREEDTAFAAAFGEHAALALRNARRVADLRAGADALAAANAEISRLQAALEEKVAAQAEELDRSREELAGRFRFGAIVGRSPALARAVDVLRKVAPTELRVLLQGESGTGKELAARALHAEGPRAARPFVSINCSTVPESLLAAELFGAVRGAYTGLAADRDGLFAQADGGTLFLDEVGTMRPDMQESLLRVLQEGEVRPLGATRPRKVDVRVIAATNIPLARLAADGRFRQDLLFRLNQVTVDLPSLRERREDIALLAAHILERAAAEAKAPRRRLSPEALAALLDHPWPGNVRELENVLRTAAALADGVDLAARDVRARLAPPVRDALPPLRPLDDWMREMLTAWSGKMPDSELAAKLGISRKSLWERRRKLGL